MYLNFFAYRTITAGLASANYTILYKFRSFYLI